MTQTLQPNTYLMIFIFAGIAWAGLLALALAVYIGISRIATPKPKPTNWTRDWEEIEKNISR